VDELTCLVRELGTAHLPSSGHRRCGSGRSPAASPRPQLVGIHLGATDQRHRRCCGVPLRLHRPDRTAWMDPACPSRGRVPSPRSQLGVRARDVVRGDDLTRPRLREARREVDVTITWRAAARRSVSPAQLPRHADPHRQLRAPDASRSEQHASPVAGAGRRPATVMILPPSRTMSVPTKVTAPPTAPARRPPVTRASDPAVPGSREGLVRRSARTIQQGRCSWRIVAATTPEERPKRTPEVDGRRDLDRGRGGPIGADMRALRLSRRPSDLARRPDGGARRPFEGPRRPRAGSPFSSTVALAAGPVSTNSRCEWPTRKVGTRPCSPDGHPSETRTPSTSTTPSRAVLGASQSRH
jgi:hypothetical protein